MGGRGASFGIETIAALGIQAGEGEVKPLNVAGMTPMDKGSRYTNAKKTLAYIENIKKDYKEEQLQVIDRHGYVTRAFQGDQHSVAVDLETRTYMRGKVVTHNHPDTWGGTFSDADLSCLRMGMRELRASAREGNYSMKAMRTADPEGFHQAYVRDSGKIQFQMKKIAYEMAEKKWSSYNRYRHENRKAQLQVMHEWYEQHAGDYGYQYKFEQAEEG